LAEQQLTGVVMSRTSTTFAAVAGIFAIALTACGGGGGGGSAAPPPATTYDLQTGISNLVRQGQTGNVALSGTVMQNGTAVSFTGTGTLTLAPSVTATFNNTATAALSQTQTIVGTITAAGQTISLPTISVVDYYDSGTDAFLGETGTGAYDVAQSPFMYPTMVVGGSTGTLGTISNYTDSTMSVSLGTTEVTYAVTAPVDPGSPVLVKVTNTTKDPMGNVIETDVTSYTLTGGGILTLTSESLQNLDSSLLATVQ
jgi:hypothetical protein